MTGGPVTGGPVTGGLIAVLDYGIGNLRSAEKALQHLGAPARLVADPDEVAGAAGVVLPGVGAFGPCAAALEASGLAGPARAAVEAGVPFLGICVGFQLLYDGSDESPGARGLGVFAGTVRRLPDGVKRPQMQWNRLDRTGARSGLLAGLGPEPWMYFVHSYAADVGPETVATCDYGGPVAAAAERGNVWGVQFHPEKSGADGLALLGNFVARCATGTVPSDGPVSRATGGGRVSRATGGGRVAASR
ncbi:MAG TPA: imidazole glycerol phosphate synthase subunit HisH [Acidimicrobiales bacterium]|nr:imidazole glycerol phosphate synthase subunit HisH [Acidimicrobiales bacterium]